MKSAAMSPLFRRTTAAALALLLAACMMPVIQVFGSQLNSQAALVRTKSMAETQHEIVMLLMKKKEYEQAAIEAHKIFEMHWPADQEPLLLKELLLISGKFLSQGQAPLGLQFIDSNSKCFKTTPSRIAILKERGYLYKTMNESDKAIDCFRKARDLENKY
jgi:tetratricopeptide (TPR) repeat protein